jgi:hypothetical protein
METEVLNVAWSVYIEHVDLAVGFQKPPLSKPLAELDES